MNLLVDTKIRQVVRAYKDRTPIQSRGPGPGLTESVLLQKEAKLSTLSQGM